MFHHPDNSIEKRLAVRQTTVKSLKSNSWFVGVRKVLWKYDLGNIEDLIADPPPKLRWKSRINRSVDDHWKEILINQATLYKTLSYINLNGYQPGVVHKLLRIEPRSARHVNRIPIKLKLLCGAYILQSNSSAYNQTAVNPTCQLCDSEDETLEHFILNYMHLEFTRKFVISGISHEVDSLLGESYFRDLTDHEKLRIILDCTVLVDVSNGKLHIEQLGSLEFHTRRPYITN